MLLFAIGGLVYIKYEQVQEIHSKKGMVRRVIDMTSDEETDGEWERVSESEYEDIPGGQRKFVNSQKAKGVRFQELSQRVKDKESVQDVRQRKSPAAMPLSWNKTLDENAREDSEEDTFSDSEEMFMSDEYVERALTHVKTMMSYSNLLQDFADEPKTRRRKKSNAEWLEEDEEIPKRVRRRRRSTLQQTYEDAGKHARTLSQEKHRVLSMATDTNDAKRILKKSRISVRSFGGLVEAHNMADAAEKLQKADTQRRLRKSVTQRKKRTLTIDQLPELLTEKPYSGLQHQHYLFNPKRSELFHQKHYLFSPKRNIQHSRVASKISQFDDEISNMRHARHRKLGTLTTLLNGFNDRTRNTEIPVE